MKTAEEYAKDLVYQFYDLTPNEAWFNPPVGVREYRAWDHAKECARVSVERIVEEIDENYDSLHASDRKVFLQEVKQQIDKL